MITLKDIVSFVEKAWSKIEAIKILGGVVLVIMGALGVPRALEYDFFSNSNDFVFFTFYEKSVFNSQMESRKEIKKLIDDDLRAKTKNNPTAYDKYKEYEAAYEWGAKNGATLETIYDAKIIAVSNDGNSDLENMVVDLSGCSKYQAFRIFPPLKTGDEYEKVNKSINVDTQWKSIRLTLPLIKQGESTTIRIYAEDALACAVQVSAEKALDRKQVKGRLISPEDYRVEKQQRQERFYRIAIYTIFIFITIIALLSYLFLHSLNNRINNLEKK